MWTLLFAACNPHDSAPLDTASDLSVVQVSAPYAAWDPVYVRMSDGNWPQPIVRDEAGDDVGLQLQQMVDEQGRGWGWRGEIPPGDYVVEGAHQGRYEHASWDRAFTVGTYGRDPTFDPAVVRDRAYLVQPGSAISWAGAYEVGDLLEQYVPPTWLVIDDVGGGIPGDVVEVGFSVYVDGTAGVCRAVHTHGALTPTGELHWHQDVIDASTTPEPIHMEDVDVRLGWLADGSEAAGGDLGGVIDTRVLTTDKFNPCQILASIGTSCWDCQGDGQPTCVDLQWTGIVLVDDPDVPFDLADPPPPCGFDAGAATEPFSCDWSGVGGGFCSFLFLPTAGTLAWVSRRRRGTAAPGARTDAVSSREA